MRDILMQTFTIFLTNTQRDRSRVGRVREGEADIERAKICWLGHLRRSKGEALRAEAIFVWGCFGGCNTIVAALSWLPWLATFLWQPSRHPVTFLVKKTTLPLCRCSYDAQ